MKRNPLPPADTTRWVIRRKYAVITAIEDGHISIEQACARYSLSREEIASWIALVGKHGLPGLRATRMQEYSGNRSVKK